MKKLLYVNLDFKKYQNKAKAQIKSFKKLNLHTEIATIENEVNDCFFRIYKYDKDDEFVVVYSKKICNAYEVQQGNNSIFSLFKRLVKTIRINNLFKKNLLNYIDNKSYDYCYVRRIGFFVIFLKNMFKFISKKCKVIYEIPTYPLDKYDSLLVNFAQMIEIGYFNMFIKKYLDVIPVILQNDVKMDDKMISIFNGVDFDKFTKVSEQKPDFKTEIKLVVIAHILSWHGYDRLINSLKIYEGNYKIKLYIYSDFNTETLKLKELVEKNGLSNNVFFMGSKNMDEIIDEISNYHIAIGSLGYHRRNGKYDTSIKNKEYCALGLPIVCSAEDLSFNDNFNYIYKVSADDSTFDIDDIIVWYKNIYKTDYKKNMRKYAKDNLSFEKYYKKRFTKVGEVDEKR